MLGRLRLTLDQCQIRRKTSCLPDSKFDYKEQEEPIKGVIIKNGKLSEDVLLQDSHSLCKVFVCSFRTGNSETAILRTYENDEPELLFDDCKYGKHVGLPQLQQHSLTQSRLALSTKSLWMAE